MNCEEAALLLDAYIDAELDVVHSIEIENHLKDCPDCTRTVENHQVLRAAIRSGSLYYEAPPMRRLLPPVRNQWRVYSTIALAASLLVAVFFAGRLQLRPAELSQEILDSHLRSLTPGHLADVISTDQHTVKPWFNGKLDFAPPVTDFAHQGFPLTGGRVDSVAGHQAAALIYMRAKHVINAYVWPTRTRDTGYEKSVQRGYNVIHWTHSGFEWWLISDLNAMELGDFAALLHAGAP